MKFANAIILAAMAAVVTNAAPQGPVTANAEVFAAESCNFGIPSDTCDCKGCEDFFNHCLKVRPNLTAPVPDPENQFTDRISQSKWCWINPKCTLSCSGDTCRSDKCCKDHCRFGDYC